jgi:hypothetical protein
MRWCLLAVSIVVVGCGGKKDPPSPTTAPPVAEQPRAPAQPEPKSADPVPIRPPVVTESLEGHDFTPVGKALLVVGACGDGPIPDGFSEKLISSHCKAVEQAQAEYQKNWLAVARPFFAEKVPSNVPKKVVYPFAGGDLSTALTVYPDADEITTISLEPAGDPRTLEALNRSHAPAGKPAPGGKPPVGKTLKATPEPPKEAAPERKTAATPAQLVKALGTVAYELRFLYRVNFSNTMNMIDAMRGASLPTQLIFGLSALEVHGYEVVSLRYFKLDAEGNLAYLTEADVKKAPSVGAGTADFRNRIFANAEVRFRKPGGAVQIYRHIQFNLDDPHMEQDPRILKHLQQKGPIAGMTKAASFLLSWDNFQTIRDYLIANVVWMVSDATGVAPKWGKPAGFEYETYGTWTGPHIPAGTSISKNWQTEFAAQPKRALPFRFGYYDKKSANHLIIMRKRS